MRLTFFKKNNNKNKSTIPRHKRSKYALEAYLIVHYIVILKENIDFILTLNPESKVKISLHSDQL